MIHETSRQISIQNSKHLEFSKKKLLRAFELALDNSMKNVRMFTTCSRMRQLYNFKPPSLWIPTATHGDPQILETAIPRGGSAG